MAEFRSERESVSAVVAHLETDVEKGLSVAEATRRLESEGANELEEAPPTPLWRRIVRELSNVLTLILLAATVISGVEWVIETPRESALPYEAIVILLIVLLNVILDLVQEARADDAVRSLKALSAPQASVIRDGRRQKIPARELVRGDLILVEAGDTVPADARLTEAANLRVEEAALTGESLPVEKSIDPIADADSLGDRRNTLFSATAVTLGRGHALVVATGRKTEVGKIARMVAETEKEQTPLEKELDRVGKRLSMVVLIICVVVFVAGLLTGRVHGLRGLLEFSLFAVAIAVAAIPEALPTIVTTGLALGTRRMAARNAIVRRLPAVETLGAATVICTDKTGTLTQNKMSVRVLFTADAEVSLEEDDPLAGLSEPARQAVRKALRAGAMANDATLVENDRGGQDAQGDPTEAALLVAARKIGADNDAERFARRAEIPFTSDRKRHTTVHHDTDHPDEWRVFVKGAPDVLLDRCAYILVNGERQRMTETHFREVREANSKLSGQTLRTLAMAERVLPRDGADAPTDEEIEEELVFLGMVGMLDPPRPEAADAVRRAKKAGIRVVMATGDHRETAMAIARELGILTEGGEAVSGSELEAMSDEDLAARVEQVQVYARVAPAHKLRIVQAWQRHGHIVAMTGDGVNDAPALRAADIGIAMGITGTDVAREAADMVLADDNFATIVVAVEEGRGIFDNIRRCLFYLLESNAAEVITMFFGILLAEWVAVDNNADLMVPLLASQLLWINLVTDGPPALALGVEPTAPDAMTRPPRDVRHGILTTDGWKRVGIIGLIMTAGTLLALDAAYPGGFFNFLVRFDDLRAAETHARSLAFTTLVLFQVFNALTHRGAEDRSAFHQIRHSPYLLGAILLAVLLQLAVLHLPFLNVAFGTVPLTAVEWMFAFGVSSLLLIGHEAYIAIFRRNRGDDGKK
ncbi:MAG: cation-translocating P-type ATPase [Capsulimonadales bacterium]|nr:cation-translocating P-type ATPase [Capsulimonadales bacterium]